jgi:hypothetical protein
LGFAIEVELGISGAVVVDCVFLGGMVRKNGDGKGKENEPSCRPFVLLTNFLPIYFVMWKSWKKQGAGPKWLAVVGECVSWQRLGGGRWREHC